MTSHLVKRSTYQQPDVSISNIIPRSQFQKKQKQLKKIKYPVKAISKAQSFKAKIKSFPGETIQNQLTKILDPFNTYRKIRGDGNCFFRALAYGYLTNLKLSTLDQCFPFLDEIEITCCSEDSINKNFKPYYNDRFLKEVLRNNWQSQFKFYLKMYKTNYKRTLVTVLSKNPYLDFIIILYFRALCLLAYTKYQSQMKDFFQGDEKKLITKYGQQSQGVILDICSRFLRINVIVYEIRQKQIIKYRYDKSIRPAAQISLLFWQNHYDIFQTNSQDDIKAQQNQMEKQGVSQYFSQVNIKFTQGVCIQCGNHVSVYQQNGLCEKCYKVSINNLQTYKKDKEVEGYCSDCGHKTLISQMFRLCRNCIKYQNRISQVAKSPKKHQNQYDYNPYKQKIQQQHNNLKHQKQKELLYENKDIFIEGKCNQCKYKEKIHAELQLCKNCLKIQQKFANIIEQKNQDIRKTNQQKLLWKCKKCGQRKSKIDKDDLCDDCTKLTKNSYEQKTCKECKKMKLLIQNGICSDCSKNKQQNKLQMCKYCHQYKFASSFIKGQCKNCHQRSSLMQSKGIINCKTCHKTSRCYKIVDGYCSQCSKFRRK